MFNIYKLLTALAISLSLTACGGSSETTSPDPINIAPLLTPLESQSIKEGKSLSITANATDSDGSIVSYLWEQIDGTAVELTNTELATLSITAPTLDEDTSITLKVTATDNDGETVASTVILSLLNNRLPTIEMITAQSFNESSEWSIEAVVSDEDGEISSVLWEQISGSVITLTDTDNTSVTVNTPIISQNEVGQLRLVVTDDDGESTEQLVDFDLMNTHHNISLAGNANLNGIALTNAAIAFKINGQVFNSTADDKGDYTLAIAIELSNANYVYQITATGTDSQETINLSRNALFSEILLSSQSVDVPAQNVKPRGITSQLLPANTDTNSTNSNVPTASIDIDALTTSESNYLASLFGNDDFTDTEYVDSNEFKKKYKNVDAELLLEIATALSYAAQHNEQIQTDNGLVGITEYLVAIYADADGKVLFEQLLDQQKANNKKDVEKLLELDTTYYGTLAASSGTVRKGIPFQQSYVFNTDGQYQQTGQAEIKTAQWQYTDGEIVMDTSAWPAQLGAPIWSDAVGQWIDCSYNPISQSLNVISSWKKGSKKAIITTTDNVVCSFNGVEYENFVGDSETYLTLFSIEDIETWQSKDLENQSIVFEHYSDSAIIDYKNLDTLTRSMEYQFSDNGTGIVVEDNNAAFIWLIDNDGQLQMTFTAGYTISWLKMYDDRSDKKGGASIFATYRQAEDFHQYQDMAVTVDKPTWQISDFMGKLDHSFMVSQPKYNAFFSGFFFQLNEDGTGSKNRTSVDGMTIERTFHTRWYVEDDKITMVYTYTWDEISGINWSNCDYKTDVNCYLYEYRTWEILLKHGQRYYVKETLSIDNDIWGRGAPSSNLSDFYTTERTNFYQPFNK